MIYFRIIKNITFSLIIFFLSYLSVNAATLYTESSNLKLNLGETATVNVYVNSQGELINNVEGVLSVSGSLEVLSVSTAGTIINLWVEQPSVSGKTISFNGGVTNPGFSGTRGKIVSITVRASEYGSGSISFSSGSVRLNDGLGTDALNSKTGSTITVEAPVIIETPVVEVPKDTPTETVDIKKTETSNNKLSTTNAEIVIQSDPTSDSEKWYNVKDTNFSWDLPSNTLAIKTLFDDNSSSDPSILYSKVFEEKKITDLEDGIWYFHIKYQNSSGWSKAAHKKIQIDNTPPLVEELDYEVLDNNLVKLKLNVLDEGSGIKNALIFVNNNQEKEILDINDNSIEYIFPSKYVGYQDISVNIYDEAGNKSEQSITIDFPKVEVPIIFKYTESVQDEKEIIISGSSIFKDTDIKVFLQNDEGEIISYETKTDLQGSFTYSVSKIGISKTSELSAWVQILLEDPNQIITSESVKIEVVGFSFIDLLTNINQKIIVFMPTITTLFMLSLLSYFVSRTVQQRKPLWNKKRRIYYIKREAMNLVEAFKNGIDDSVRKAKEEIEVKDIKELEANILKDLLDNFKTTEKLISSKLRKPRKTSKKTDFENKI